MLLDIYQSVLTSNDHVLSTSTPLDVCTGPISHFAKETVRKAQPEEEETYDGMYLNPVYQTL
jgi:hypothetical protein